MPSAVLLGAMAMVALFLTLRRPWSPVENGGHAVRASLLAVFAQAGHFTEELSTGFHELFPALFGRPPMPLPAFVGLNLALLVIWLFSIQGLATRRRWALFPLWFLAIVSVANALAHPVFALISKGYFPGLLSAPVAGLAGLLLMRILLRETHSSNAVDVAT
jgi:hypothetical protein